MKRFEKQSILVTGGAQGIGGASVRRFASEGARIVIADYNREGAEKLASSLRKEAVEAEAVFYDAGDVQSGRDIVRFTIEKFGTIDVLVNNVGVEDLKRDLDVVRLDIDYFDSIFHVNLRSMIVTAQEAIPEMVRKGRGAIVNVASMSGVTGDFRGTFYGLTKAGVINLSRYIATQYGKQGIRCNSVAPGLVLTPAATGSLPENIRDIFLKYNAVNYLGEAEDIAATIAFLASADAKYINGQNILADGGMICHNPTVGDLTELYKIEKK